MAKTLTHELASEEISALKALIGRPAATLHAAVVDADPRQRLASCHGGAIWLGAGDYVTIQTEWKTSPAEQDYHLLRIGRSDKPLDLPFNQRSGAIGPASLIALGAMGETIVSIDVIALTAELDGETLRYDHALTFRYGDGGATTLSTEHDSVLGALEARPGEATGSDMDLGVLETRMTLK